MLSLLAIATFRFFDHLLKINFLIFFQCLSYVVRKSDPYWVTLAPKKIRPPLSMNLWILASVDPVELQPSSKSWVSLSLIDDWSFFFCGVVWIRVCCSVEECLKFCNASSILPPLGINPVKILFHWPYKEFNLKEVMSRYTHRQTWMRQPRTYCQRTHKAMYSVTTGILKTNYI